MSARDITGYRVERQFPDGQPQPASVFDDVDRHEVSERGDLVVWASGDPVVRYTVAHGHWTAAMPVITQPIEEISVGRISTGLLSMTLVDDRGCECGCGDDEDDAEPEPDAVELAEQAVALATRQAAEAQQESARAVADAHERLAQAKRDAA